MCSLMFTTLCLIYRNKLNDMLIIPRVQSQESGRAFNAGAKVNYYYNSCNDILITVLYVVIFHGWK